MTDSDILDHEPTAASRRKKQQAGAVGRLLVGGIAGGELAATVSTPSPQPPRRLPRLVRRAGQIPPPSCALVRSRRPAPTWRPLTLRLSRRSPVAPSTGSRLTQTAQRTKHI